MMVMRPVEKRTIETVGCEALAVVIQAFVLGPAGRGEWGTGGGVGGAREGVGGADGRIGWILEGVAVAWEDLEGGELDGLGGTGDRGVVKGGLYMNDVV